MLQPRFGRVFTLVLASGLSLLTVGVHADDAPVDAARTSNFAADRLVQSLAPPLRVLSEDVLRQSPEVARARAEADAAVARARQMGSWPDPSAMLTLFALPPETRVGPQRLAVSVSQPLPWLGKLELRQKEALWAAVAADARWQAKRLDLVTEVRKHFYELTFVTEQAAIIDQERLHLIRHEELAQAQECKIGRAHV